MKAWILAIATMGLMACGGGTSTGGTGGGSSSQTCDQKWSCINGACQCDAGPKKDNSCCDPNDTSCTSNKCDTYCRYCM